MTSNTARIQQLEQVKNDLASGDLTTVVQALKKCEDLADARLVVPLIDLFATTRIKTIRDSVSDMLGSLKVSNTEESFIDALRNSEYKPIRRELLSFMWNSGLQPVQHLAELTEIAVSGNFEELLEGLTLIENLEGPLAEEQWLESVSLVNNQLNQNSDEKKRGLLVEFKIVLQNLQQFVE